MTKVLADLGHIFMKKVFNLSQSPRKALLALQALVIYNFYHRSQRGYPQEYYVVRHMDYTCYAAYDWLYACHAVAINCCMSYHMTLCIYHLCVNMHLVINTLECISAC